MVNVFWPKAIKQSANAALLSVGWKFGTFRGLAQAAGWDPDQGRYLGPWHNPVAVSSVISTAVAWAGMNALWQYMYTGTLPTQTDTPWKDMMLFRTGSVGKRYGAQVPIRGMIPGEPKEVYDLARILFTTWGNPSLAGQAITEYAMNATSPFWQVLHGVTTGEDGVGHHIGEYPGGWRRFLSEQFNPMFLQAARANRVDSNIPIWEQQFFGTREAAPWAENPTGYDKFLQDQKLKTEKSELKWARREAAEYQNSEWLQEYIKEMEQYLVEQGGSTGTGRISRRTSILAGLYKRPRL